MAKASPREVLQRFQHNYHLWISQQLIPSPWASPSAWACLVPGSASASSSVARLEAIGRNPEASGSIVANMFIGIAFTEALAIFALVVGFIIKFT